MTKSWLLLLLTSRPLPNIDFHYYWLISTQNQSYLATDVQSTTVMVPGHHLGTAINFYIIFIESIFRNLPGFSYGASTLTRAKVCNLSVQCYWALPALSLSSHILLSHRRLGPFLPLLRLARLRWKYFNPLPYGAIDLYRKYRQSSCWGHPPLKNVFWDVTPCGSCKNRNIPEDNILHSHRRENLKSSAVGCYATI
jgi:hypothetical protein